VDDGRQPKAALWAIAFALVTTIVTYIQFEANLATSRPRLHGPPETSTIGDQKILARLWQDPFTGQSPDSDQCDLASTRHLSQVWTNGQQELGGTNCYVMAVLVEGFPYPEDVERRLRFRYAVETAFFNQGFAPADISHIGMAQLQWPVAAWMTPANLMTSNWYALADSNTNATLNIPFEWMTRGPTNVLVLWLAEEQFADVPLHRCELLLRNLGLNTNGGEAFKLIGPRSSDTLKAMLKELQAPNLGQCLPDVTNPNFEIYSPQATAPDVLIAATNIPPPPVNTTRAWAAGQFKDKLHHVAFTNFIVTDDILAEKIADELRLRERDISESGSYVALISESDTSYGRALPACMAAAINLESTWTNPTAIPWTNSEISAALAAKIKAYADDPASFPGNVLRYSYLRGLDGVGAADPQKSPVDADEPPGRDKKGDSDPSAPASRSEQDRERSQGQSQLDYLRRLADQLQENDDELAAEGRHIRAIGVLGSDAYDKLLLLKALRHHFKEQIFFATDLDARYQDPQERENCRNLIVASAEGLQPRGTNGTKDYRMPTFREVYQTTVYNACTAALGGRADPATNAHIYEIGLNRTIELGVPQTSHWLKLLRLHWCGIPLGVVGIIGLFTMFRGVTRAAADIPIYYWKRINRRPPAPSAGPHGYSASPGVRRHRFYKLIAVDPRMIPIFRKLRNRHFLNRPDGERAKELEAVANREDLLVFLTLLVGLTLIGVITGCFWVDSQEAGGEPFYWTEGLSIWPTEVVRLAADLFGILCLIHAWHLYKRQRLLLWHHFFGPREIRDGVDLDANLPLLTGAQIDDFDGLVRALTTANDPVSAFLAGRLQKDRSWPSVQGMAGARRKRAWAKILLARSLNLILTSHSVLDDCWVEKIWKESRGKELMGSWKYRLCSRNDPAAEKIPLRDETGRLAEKNPGGSELVWLNRQIIDMKLGGFLVGTTARKAPPLPLGETRSSHLPPRSGGFVNLIGKRLNISINFWPLEPDVVHARDKLFARYLERGTGNSRLWRVSVMLFFFLAFGMGLFLLEGFPRVPGRGISSNRWDHAILMLSVPLFAALALYVADAARLTERFLLRLGDGVTVWPQHRLLQTALDRNMDPAHLGGYFDVRFAAFQTRELGRLIYYPFIMLALMLVARNQMFAPWSWPWSLLGIVLTSSLITFLCAFHIRRAAARVRDEAVEALQGIQIKYAAGEDVVYKWKIDLGEGGMKDCQATNYSVKIEGLIKELQAIKSGAYARLLQDDSVIAALIPALGAALLAGFQKFFL